MDQHIRRLRGTRLRLAKKNSFFAHLLFYCNLEVTSDPAPTRGNPAGVSPSGRILFYAPFLDKVSDAHLEFILCHEVMHLAGQFWSRMKDRNFMKWNIAHDYAINHILKTEGFEILPGGLISDQYQGAAELIYDQLPEFDPKWKEYLDAQEGACRKESKDDVIWSSRMKKAVQEAKKRGHEPSEALLDFVDRCTPQVPWDTLLSRWMGANGPKQDVTYRRPSRRSSGTDFILPGWQSQLPDLAVLWDTSGSMCDSHSTVWAEAKEILSSYGTLRILTCDAAVKDDLEVEGEGTLELVGGGGSDFRPAFEALKHYRGVVVAFTDGMITVPEHQPSNLMGVIWVLVGGDTPPASWGDVIRTR